MFEFKKLDLCELMVRVKLPDSAAYAGNPDGDALYEQDWKAACFAAKPQGYEIHWPRKGQSWPKDSEGYTWVRLYCSNEKSALVSWMERANRLEQKLSNIQQFIKQEGLDRNYVA